MNNDPSTKEQKVNNSSQIEAGEALAQAIRTNSLDDIQEALAECHGVTTDPVEFASHLIRCMRREAAAGSIVNHFEESAE